MVETPAERLERLGTDPEKWAKEFVLQFNGNVVNDDGLFTVNVDADTMTRWFTNVLAVGEANGVSLSAEATPKQTEERLKRSEDRVSEARTALVDSVNHPPHYRGPQGLECIDVVEHMHFNLGNAVKYIWRVAFGGKGNDIEDLRKAVWYINREIEGMENKVT